jgi:hypothetical protein
LIGVLKAPLLNQVGRFLERLSRILPANNRGAQENE